MKVPKKSLFACALLVGLGGPSTTFAKASSSEQQALFITHYALGDACMEERPIPDLSETAFALDGPIWRMEKALTLTASVPVFERNVDEMAPDLRGHLLFAIDDAGRLGLYRDSVGPGSLVKTFGSVNGERLAHTMPDRMWTELRQGVHVNSMDEYRSVLETVAEYM